MTKGSKNSLQPLLSFLHTFTLTAQKHSLFLHTTLRGILSSHSLGSFDGLSDEAVTLLGVTKVLAMEDLEFPVLLDKGVDEDSIPVERCPEGGREHARDLRRVYVLWSEMTRWFCIKRRTWTITFPGASITS